MKSKKKASSKAGRKLTKQEIAWAYCENEATYGYFCDDPECPHCRFWEAQPKDETGRPVYPSYTNKKGQSNASR